MFTIEQLKAAHSKVKTGAVFPAYIKEIKAMGVSHYETFVADGHADYYGKNNFKTSSPSKYDALSVANQCNIELFKSDLKIHQQGQTDYSTFINQSAKHGVEKWVVDLQKMTCIYYDKAGNEILTENIPQ